MSKSPEEYFQDQHLAPETPVRGAAFTEAELSFMRKYMGLDTLDTHEILGTFGIKPGVAAAGPAPEALPETADALPGDDLAGPAPAPSPEAELAPETESVPAEDTPEPEAAPEKTSVEQEPEPAGTEAQTGPETVDLSEVETFQETVDQQFLIIKAALDGLKQNGNDTSLSDALYRGLITVQNSSSYMGLGDIRAYAERTAGIVDQGRKTGTDFSVITGLLEQEYGIIKDMVTKSIESLFKAAAADEAGPVAESVVAAAAPVPEPVAEVAPDMEVKPAAAPEPASEQVSAPAPASVQAPAPTPAPVPTPAPAPEAAPAPVPTPAPAPVYPEDPPHDLHDEMSVEEPLDSILRRESELLMVGFYIGKQEFTVPTLAVQEVIRYEVPSKMPAAPKFVAGVINLRGKITPLVYLRDMLEMRQTREDEARFIIVCRRKGLQIGLIIDRVHTMYRVPQSDIEWGIEGLLGINNADFISGLLKLNESLVGIVSVDCIVDRVLA